MDKQQRQEAPLKKVARKGFLEKSMRRSQSPKKLQEVLSRKKESHVRRSERKKAVWLKCSKGE
jgi:hypothetical protein